MAGISAPRGVAPRPQCQDQRGSDLKGDLAVAKNDDVQDAKQRQLGIVRVDLEGALTNQQGARVDHTDDSLSAGEPGS